MLAELDRTEYFRVMAQLACKRRRRRREGASGVYPSEVVGPKLGLRSLPLAALPLASSEAYARPYGSQKCFSSANCGETVARLPRVVLASLRHPLG